MVSFRIAGADDKKLICAWYSEWGSELPSVDLMPPTTVVALHMELPVASAGLILTNVPSVAMIENVIKNPSLKVLGREALPQLFNYISEYAKAFHVKHLFISALNEQVGERYMEYGFKRKSANLGYFYKMIGDTQCHG